MVQYLIRRRPTFAPPLSFPDPKNPAWEQIPSLQVDQFHPASSNHRPQTQARIMYDDAAIHVHFHVRDRYVKSLCTQYQDMVCNDSCVEFFVEPKPERGYFNFELNCGGTMLLYYIEDATRAGGAFARYTKVAPEHAQMIQVATTMPKKVPVEIAEPVEWMLSLRIPFVMMEPHVGTIGDVRGQTWRGDLYKCGDQTSHPHWASWAPIGEDLNFHQPQKFGELQFE
jgi:hypothetical protein